MTLFHMHSFLNEKKAKRVRKMYPCFEDNMNTITKKI